MIKWPRNPRQVCVIPQTCLGLRGHLITNLLKSHAMTYNNIFFFAMYVPPTDRPGPPVVGRVTHCSIELLWDQERKIDDPRSGRMKYSVQEEEEKGETGFSNVYW